MVSEFKVLYIVLLRILYKALFIQFEILLAGMITTHPDSPPTTQWNSGVSGTDPFALLNSFQKRVEHLVKFGLVGNKWHVA